MKREDFFMNFSNQTYDEERALYGIHNATVSDCTFDGPADGESALKETNNLFVERCYLIYAILSGTALIQQSVKLP